MIDVNNLTKKYGELTAVDGLSFHVDEGEVFGLLGPNGAGKTTTIRMLCCLISKTRGEARIGGYEVGNEADSLKIRKMIGLVPFGAVYVLSEISVLPLSSANLLYMAAVLLVVDVILFYVVRATFQRDEILTKWK
jgi:ABC-type multidrug transport system ATPase subunit